MFYVQNVFDVINLMITEHFILRISTMFNKFCISYVSFAMKVYKKAEQNKKQIRILADG